MFPPQVKVGIVGQCLQHCSVQTSDIRQALPQVLLPTLWPHLVGNIEPCVLVSAVAGDGKASAHPPLPSRVA